MNTLLKFFIGIVIFLFFFVVLYAFLIYWAFTDLIRFLTGG